MKPIAGCIVPAPEHTFQGHPENPDRMDGLLAFQDRFPADQVMWLQSSPAQTSEVAAVHAESMLDSLYTACQNGPAIIDIAPTYVNRGSWEAAFQAAGGTLGCSRAVISGNARTAFALVRPPGHHAEPDHSMGFCLLNNLAIAVKDAQAKGVERILIVDFDGHHGNGTERVFWDDPAVAFLSTHRSGIYPGTGMLQDAPHARGRLVNIPLPAYAGDIGFNLIFEEFLRPWADQWQPQMLFVSAGYDSHWMDPLVGLGLTTRGYYRLTQILLGMARAHCQGRAIFVLEGGYHKAALVEGVQASLAVMVGQADFPDQLGRPPFPEPDLTGLVSTLRKLHKVG